MPPAMSSRRSSISAPPGSPTPTAAPPNTPARAPAAPRSSRQPLSGSRRPSRRRPPPDLPHFPDFSGFRSPDTSKKTRKSSKIGSVGADGGSNPRFHALFGLKQCYKGPLAPKNGPPKAPRPENPPPPAPFTHDPHRLRRPRGRGGRRHRALRHPAPRYPSPHAHAVSALRASRWHPRPQGRAVRRLVRRLRPFRLQRPPQRPDPLVGPDLGTRPERVYSTPHGGGPVG